MSRKKQCPEIIEAVWKKDLKEIKRIAAKGGDLNGSDGDGRTALMQATTEGCTEIAKWLLENGANPNIQDKGGRSALHLAAQDYKIDIARQLLEKNAEVDLRDEFGNTPLSNAVFYSNGRGEMIRLLRSCGCDPRKENHSGVSPLQLANSIGNYDVKQYFQDSA